ncbi:MAG: hypothetical protein V7609_2102 [Verrucomicrobiota bacterium]
MSRRGRPPKSPAVVRAEAESGFAPNQDVLAELLGVDRRTITNARKRFALDAPKKRADGRYPILEYKAWLDRHVVRGRGANNPNVNDLDARALDLAERRLKLERAQFELEKAKEAMLSVAQFERAWFKTHAALLAAINAFGPRVNEMLEGLDYNDRAAVLENECERLKQTIAECDYLIPEEEEDGG